MRSNFVASIEEFINLLIVRSVMRDVEGHGDVTTIGVNSISEYSVVNLVIPVSYGIIKSEEYHLRNLLWIESIWSSCVHAQAVGQDAFRAENTQQINGT